MSMTILAIIMIVVAIVEIFGFTTALLLMHDKMEELRMERETFNASFFKHLESFMATAKAIDEKRELILEKSNEQNKILEQQYETIEETYDYMNARYMEICEHYSKLLECWSGVEERYSDCYEQLKYQNERFDRIEKCFEKLQQNMLQPVVYPFSDPYMYCTAIDPGDCQYSNLSQEPIGDGS